MKETLANTISLSVALGIVALVQSVKTEVVETNKDLVENVSHNFSGVNYEILGDEKIKGNILYGDFQQNLKDLENGDTLLEHKRVGRNIYGLKINIYPKSRFEIIKKY